MHSQRQEHLDQGRQGHSIPRHGIHVCVREQRLGDTKNVVFRPAQHPESEIYIRTKQLDCVTNRQSPKILNILQAGGRRWTYAGST